MKASYYNFFFPFNREGDYLLYNSISNSLIRVSKSNICTIRRALNGKNIADPSIVKMLAEQRFLIPRDIDELKEIQIDHMATKFACDVLSLIIAPTLNCNFDCAYCFEGNSCPKEKMSKNIQDSIIKFAEANLEYHSSYKITWLGGEPLMAFDVVKYLSSELIKLCSYKNIAYSAELITNGYLLNEKILNHLINCKVNKIQITIDGDNKCHDKRRFLKNGGKTYERIMSNLHSILEKTDKFEIITVRINIDKDNLESILTLMEELKKIDPKNKLNISLANTINNGSAGLSEEEFAKSVMAIHSDFIKIGYGYANIEPPHRLHSYCVTATIKGFIIDPNGELYKCVEDIGHKDKIVGNIREDSFYLGIGKKNRAYCYKYIGFDPTEHPKCYKCKILPLCMGGCAMRRINHNDLPQCVQYKYNLKTTLINYAKLKQGEQYE